MSEPRLPRRPEPYKSDWSPRPIPQPVEERRTADPPTPRLRELAERERQRASLVVESAAPSAPAAPVLPEPPTNPCAEQGALATSKAAAAFVNGVRELQGEWPSLSERGKRAGLRSLINAPLKPAGLPTVAVASADLPGARVGAFDAPNWTLQIKKDMIDAPTLSDADAQELAKTTYHEARHAEQYFLAARREAATERDARSLHYKTGVSNDAMRAALDNPLRDTAPGGATAGAPGEASSPPISLGTCADAMRTALMTNRSVRQATIDAMDAKGQALAHATTRPAYDRAKREYQASVSAYLALPEERDAWALEPLVADAWARTRPRATRADTP